MSRKESIIQWVLSKYNNLKIQSNQAIMPAWVSHGLSRYLLKTGPVIPLASYRVPLRPVKGSSRIFFSQEFFIFNKSIKVINTIETLFLF